MPFELRPYPNPTLEPEGDYLSNAWSQSIYPMAERMGVKMVLPKVSPQPHTHLAFEGYQFAKEHGKGNQYNHRMFTAFFQDEQDIGDAEILTNLAGEIGLNENEFREALASGRYKEVHQKALHHAYNEVNVTAVPTFVIGDRVLRGLYTQDTLEKVIDEQIKKQPPDLPEGMSCGIDGC